MLPRFFIARANAVAGEPTLDRPEAIEDVLATVTLGLTEMVIGIDRGGRLLAVDARVRRSLGARAQAQLAFHEVASGRTLAVEADELYLFDLQLIELLADAPGVNDPLYLYGALRGPYPGALGTATSTVDGQLTVSRADLLAALVDGVERAFVHSPTARGSRCAHALLPGEPAESIDRGRGLILTFPLADTGLLGGAANELLTAQIFYDVLRALRGEVSADDEELPPLPVPSREAVEKQLVAQGWRIEGDCAVRTDSGGGIVGTLFGREQRRPLPRQAAIEEYVAEARSLLARMGAPTSTTAAIVRRRDRGGGRPIPPPPVATTASTIGAPLPTPPPDPPASPAPRPRLSTPRSEWIKDFIDAHTAAGAARPQLVHPARVLSPESTPDWMRDFSEPEPERSDEDAGPSPVPPPDWSKDFD